MGEPPHDPASDMALQFQELQGLYNEAPVGLCLFDRELRFIRINRILADINGRSVADHLGRTVREIVPELADAAEPLLRRVFAEGKPLRDIILSGSTLREPNVIRHWREDYYPVRNADGDVWAVGAIVFDITAQRRFEAELRERDERLRAALAVSRTGTFRWTIADDAVEADGSLDRLLFLPPGETPHALDTLLQCIDKDDRDAFGAALRQAAQDGGDLSCDFRLPAVANSPVRWLTARCRAFAGQDGRPLYITGACVDITERKEAEERQRLLVAELNHRVRNSLAAVQSIAVQTLTDAQPPAVTREAFLGRLRALGHTHTLLADADWQGANLGDVVRLILRPYEGLPGQHPSSGRVRLHGQHVRLTPRATVCLGMILHELATNAAKYGGLSRPTGSAAVSWSLVEEDETVNLCLLWEEAGGPPVSPPVRPGFGLNFVRRSLRHDLGGTADVTFQPAGLTCRISMPARAAVRAA